MSLQALLEERIAREGSIGVDDYMTLALSHPEFGYYMTRDPFGVRGDFTTAPEISQIFGELCGAWIAQQWMAQQEPSPCVLLELGPGRGTLMKDMLRATARIEGFHSSLYVRLLEISPVLQALQRQTLRDTHPRLEWITALEELPSLPLYAVANEFFDALPIRQFVQEQARRVVQENGALRLVPDVQPQDVRETCEVGIAIITRLSEHMKRHGGALLAIDYGYEGESRGDTLQAVREHRYVSPLETPGEADVTAHVAFSALMDAATQTGASAYGPVPQGQFLRRLGAELRASALCYNATPQQRAAILSGLERLMAPHAMGRLFKAIAITPSGLPVPDGFG